MELRSGSSRRARGRWRIHPSAPTTTSSTFARRISPGGVSLSGDSVDSVLGVNTSFQRLHDSAGKAQQFRYGGQLTFRRFRIFGIDGCPVIGWCAQSEESGLHIATSARSHLPVDSSQPNFPQQPPDFVGRRSWQLSGSRLSDEDEQRVEFFGPSGRHERRQARRSATNPRHGAGHKTVRARDRWASRSSE